MLRFLFCLTLFVAPFLSFASVSPSGPAKPATTSIHEVLKMKPAAIEKLIGKKLTFKQKIQLKAIQLKYALSKKFAESEPTPQQLKQGRIASTVGGIALLILAVGATGVVVPGLFALLTLPLGIMALILGIRSSKGNGNTLGIIGIVTGAAVLFFWLLALILIAAFLSSWG
jgi:hypothetical protein